MILQIEFICNFDIRLKRTLVILILAIPAQFSFAQTEDSTKAVSHFGGKITITTKGISTIPNMTLGKPAAIFDMSVGRRLSFDPQFRFSLEGKPWSFLFWWRYELINTERVQFKIGVHPAFSFKTVIDTTLGASEESIVTTRYLAAELAPGYSIAKNVRFGLYYLYIHGVEKEITQNTNLLAFQVGFSNIKITNQIFMLLNPQIYYLKMDKTDGFYVTAVLTLAKRNFPFTISSLVNRTLQTDIPGDNILWNISLIYSFNKNFIAK